jgi:hypothetical protein
MKKNLPLSRIPNDIKYRLGLAAARLEEVQLLLASLDPAAWPHGEHRALAYAMDVAQACMSEVQATRPLKKTEVASLSEEASPVAPEAPASDIARVVAEEHGVECTAPAADPAS